MLSWTAWARKDTSEGGEAITCRAEFDITSVGCLVGREECTVCDAVVTCRMEDGNIFDTVVGRDEFTVCDAVVTCRTGDEDTCDACRVGDGDTCDALGTRRMGDGDTLGTVMAC